jgi:uncharacterized protein YciI
MLPGNAAPGGTAGVERAMYFIVLAEDRPDSLERRIAHRQAHLEYWNGLPGCVQIAGAMLTGDDGGAQPKGSAFVIAAAGLDEARRLVAADPFAMKDIFGSVRIEVFRPSIGAWAPG